MYFGFLGIDHLFRKKTFTLASSDPLWPIYTVWRHRFGSKLAQVIKPLQESMLTFYQWGLVAFSWGQFHRKCSVYLPLIKDSKLLMKNISNNFKITATSSSGQWVNMICMSIHWSKNNDKLMSWHKGMCQISIGSGNGLLSEGTKSLTESVLISHSCGSVAFIWGQYHSERPSYYSVWWEANELIYCCRGWFSSVYLKVSWSISVHGT